jgi:hypothetical protein
MLAMSLIPPPSWAEPFYRTDDSSFEAVELERVFAQRAAFMLVFQEAVQGYIDDESLTNHTSDEGFPARDRLTGEYYVGSERFWVNHEPWFHKVGRKREYCFSIEARCLERRWKPNVMNQDYLGLVVRFEWQPEAGAFRYHGDIDSMVL